MTVKLEMKIDVDEGSELELKSLEHHIENLVSLDEWPEISCIYDVHVNRIEE